MSKAEKVTPIRPAAAPVTCECGHRIWDGEALRARVVLPLEGRAKCRCKRWVEVPVGLIPY